MQPISSLQTLINKAFFNLNYNDKPVELYEPINYILALGGKRMRPLLALMACDMMGGDANKALKAAMGLEVFHNFTLLHDDIMDNAPLRRAQPTVHKKWNNNVAILSGDTMFVKSYELMMQVEDKHLRRVLDIFNKTAVEVCEGQQLDMNFETRNNVSISEYEKMIELKTSVLLAASLQIGALIGGATEEDANHLYEFGRNTGIAFQLQDDILDVYGDADKFGKQVGGDIVANKKTFLLLKALEMTKGDTEASLHKLIKNEAGISNADKVIAVTNIYNQLGIKELAQKEMESYFSEAIKHLEAVSIPAAEKQALLAFAESLMVREV
jgi:geranylgeranyl diphosphate synthase type II